MSQEAACFSWRYVTIDLPVPSSASSCLSVRQTRLRHARRRQDSEDAINGKSARTSDHEKSDPREYQQVKLKPLALSANPVHEEVESMMHSQNCDQHVHTDSERRDSAQESEDEPDPTEEFGRDCQEGQRKLAGCFRVARSSITRPERSRRQTQSRLDDHWPGCLGCRA
jgi:hypothetical protein